MQINIAIIFLTTDLALNLVQRLQRAEKIEEESVSEMLSSETLITYRNGTEKRKKTSDNWKIFKKAKTPTICKSLILIKKTFFVQQKGNQKTKAGKAKSQHKTQQVGCLSGSSQFKSGAHLTYH